MIRIHGLKDSTSEYLAAEKLVDTAVAAVPALVDHRDLVLEVFPSAQCYGQRTQDIDLIVFFADYRKKGSIVAPDGRRIHSFCAVVEIKNHPPHDVEFVGNKCMVRYNNGRHDVSSQSERQKYALLKYIDRNCRCKPPFVMNLIWLQKVPQSQLPRMETNLLGSDVRWDQLLSAVSLLSQRGGAVETFSARSYLQDVLVLFSRRLAPSQIDRMKLEAITKSVVGKDRKYVDELGEQLLVFRGRGGTGKTVRLLQLAMQAYDELGWRVVLLTYNKALVADLRRTLTLIGAKDAVGERSIAVRTIHSFMYEWMSALEIVEREPDGSPDGGFFERYEDYKERALEYLSSGLVEADDVEQARARRSRGLAWDLLLIDESQDWPSTERDLIYRLYGHKKVIIADGVDQFVRGVERISWQENVPTTSRQIVPLRKSLRLKSSLCQAVGHFAEEIEYSGWNLSPLDESYGGRVIIVTGDALSKEFHGELSEYARSDGNKPIDTLFCVPPSWVEQEGGVRRSRVAKRYAEWNLDCWDAVDPAARDDYPESVEQFRIVQYESCRGLEGWVVMNFALDELFELKLESAQMSESERSDMFVEKEELAWEYAKKWIMIPLTRAIDTLVIHVSSVDSYIGKVAMDLHERYPESIELRRL